MADQQQNSGTNIDFVSDISIKLQDLEEKQNIIKDRVLLIGENLVSQKDETENEISQLKAQISSLSEELRRLKLIIERILEETDNFARKNEFQILQRQFEIFQPMNIARISDVETIVGRELRKLQKTK
jgi:hypothetical protein